MDSVNKSCQVEVNQRPSRTSRSCRWRELNGSKPAPTSIVARVAGSGTTAKEYVTDKSPAPTWQRPRPPIALAPLIARLRDGMRKQTLFSRQMLSFISHTAPQKQAVAALRTHNDRPSVTSMESKFASHHPNFLRWNQPQNPRVTRLRILLETKRVTSIF